MVGIRASFSGETRRNRDGIQRLFTILNQLPFLRGSLLNKGEAIVVSGQDTKRISHGLGRTPKGAIFLDIFATGSLVTGPVCTVEKTEEYISFNNPNTVDVELKVFVW